METILNVSLPLVQANPESFAESGKLRFGVPYFLRSEVTGKFDHKMYITDGHTDLFEFRRYMRRGMVYQLANPHEPFIINVSPPITVWPFNQI